MIIFIILFILTIFYFKSNLIDTFVTFKKCEKRPVAVFLNNYLMKMKLKKPKTMIGIFIFHVDIIMLKMNYLI